MTLLAARLGHHARPRVSTAAWYRKRHPTFTDTLAAVRHQIWTKQVLLTSRHSDETTKPRPALRDGIAYALLSRHLIGQSQAKVAASRLVPLVILPE